MRSWTAAQRAEHYEMAAYGTVAAWADQLGQSEIAELLRGTLAEEKQADALLTQLAESGANQDAIAGIDNGGEARRWPRRVATAHRAGARTAAAAIPPAMQRAAASRAPRQQSWRAKRGRR
jgi:rubrerythrin